MNLRCIWLILCKCLLKCMPNVWLKLLHHDFRYFKQIAKSVRSNGAAASGSEENADDFLGCINIPLNVSSNSAHLSCYNSQATHRVCHCIYFCATFSSLTRRSRSLVMINGLSWSPDPAPLKFRENVTWFFASSPLRYCWNLAALIKGIN